MFSRGLVDMKFASARWSAILHSLLLVLLQKMLYVLRYEALKAFLWYTPFYLLLLLGSSICALSHFGTPLTKSPWSLYQKFCIHFFNASLLALHIWGLSTTVAHGHLFSIWFLVPLLRTSRSIMLLRKYFVPQFMFPIHSGTSLLLYSLSFHT